MTIPLTGMTRKYATCERIIRHLRNALTFIKVQVDQKLRVWRWLRGETLRRNRKEDTENKDPVSDHQEKPEPHRFDIAQLELLDSYRLLSGAAMDLRSSSLPARLFLLDLAARLAQGQGYHELVARVMRPDVPLYEGLSPLAPAVQELPALRAAHDLVYRAGVAEGIIQPGPGENAPLPSGLRALGPRTPVAPGREGSLTTEAIVTVGEAMEMLGITRQAVINSVRTGRVRGEQHGKLWILSREDVLRYRMGRDERRQLRNQA